MKFTYLLSIILFLSYNTKAQNTLVLEKIIPVKGEFVEQVTNAVNRWHQNNRTNDLYNKNVDYAPKLITGDSILYELVFITKSTDLMLWKGNGKFTKSGDKIICEVSYIHHVKHSLTQPDEKFLNGKAIEKKVKQFFKVISK